MYDVYDFVKKINPTANLEEMRLIYLDVVQKTEKMLSLNMATVKCESVGISEINKRFVACMIKIVKGPFWASFPDDIDGSKRHMFVTNEENADIVGYFKPDIFDTEAGGIMSFKRK